MVADWAITPTEHRNADEILGWNLESPLPGPEADDGSASEVRFRGWLLARGGSGRIILSHGGAVLADRPADLPRPDVAQALVADPADRPDMERCGFDLRVPRRLGPYQLVAKSAGQTSAVMTFEILDRQGGPYALIGKERQLFLGGDSNDSIGQFIQDRSLSESSVSSWLANLDAMPGWETSLGLRMAFLVAPAKEEIFPEAFPFRRARRTVMDDFRNRFAGKGAVIPIHPLRAQRQFAYSETDTHWTDYGATIAAREVLKHWQMDAAARDALPREFAVRQRQGDLGVKLEPRRASYELVFPESPDCFLVFDNGVRNQGCLRLWSNPQAPVSGGCLILGDSFGTNLAQALISVFAQVVFAYRPAGFDPTLIQLVKPSHAILQITQRFLHGSPDRRGTLFDTAASKIQGLPENERATLTNHLRGQVDGPFSSLATEHLNRL